jgi:hypothetical protein
MSQRAWAGHGVGAGAARRQADVDGDAAIPVGLALGEVDEARQRPQRVAPVLEVVAGVGRGAGDGDQHLAGALALGDDLIGRAARLEHQRRAGAARQLLEQRPRVVGAGLLVGDRAQRQRQVGQRADVGERGERGADRREPALHVEHAGAAQPIALVLPHLERAGREHRVVVADQHDALGRRRRGERRRGPHQVIARAGGRDPARGQAGQREARLEQVGDLIAAGQVAGVRVDGDPPREQRQELGGARVGGGQGAIDEVGHRAAR